MIYMFHLNNDFTGSTRVFKYALDSLRDKFKVFVVITGRIGLINNDSADVRTLKKRSKIYTLLVANFMGFLHVLRLKEIELVYCSTILSIGPAFGAVIKRRRIILHQHEIGLGNRLLFAVLKFTWSLIKPELIAVSNYTRINSGIEYKSSRVIYNPTEFKPLRNDRRSYLGRVLMVASCRKYKGVLEFFKLAEIMPHLNFTLVLSDADQTILDHMTGLNNLNVIIQPKAIDEIYKQNDILLNMSIPSLWIETFGMTIVEGFCFGLPAVAPNYGGPTEIITDGFDGFLMDNIDAHHYKLAIERFQDNSYYCELSKNARIKAAQFKMSNFQEELLRCL